MSRRVKQLEYAHAIRQMLLSIRKDDGDSLVSECACGNLFVNKIYASTGKFKGAKRQYCVGCSLRPTTRIRTKWSKAKQCYVTYEVRR